MSGRLLLSFLPRFDVAACRDADPELFFPGDGVNGARVEQARDICRSCPSTTTCCDWAIANNVDGIWGGTTTAERNATRRAIRVWARLNDFPGNERTRITEHVIDAYNRRRDQEAS
jgi:WhiB family redox-sensing transcriptional regulator